MAELQLQSTLTCPRRGDRATKIMPTNACEFFYKCGSCGALLHPKPGDCCVFCSYGDAPVHPCRRSENARLALHLGRGDSGGRWPQ